MTTTKRTSQRGYHPRLLKSRLAEMARLTPTESDEVLVKGEGHGFSKLDHFSPDQVEMRVTAWLNGRRT